MDCRIDNIIDAIREINKCNAVTEYVITGGEPIANLKMLKQIVSECNKRVFINTTLPNQSNMDEVLDFINFEPKVQGINISRHMSFHFNNVADKTFIKRIKKPIRINSVITTIEAVGDFIHEWGSVSPNIMINLRADYRKVTKKTLKIRDGIDDYLLEHFMYKGTTSCMVCNSEFFGGEFGTICYHRGLEKSSLLFPDKCFVNDVIVYPNGRVCKDWNPDDNDEEFVYSLFNNKIK